MIAWVASWPIRALWVAVGFCKPPKLATLPPAVWRGQVGIPVRHVPNSSKAEYFKRQIGHTPDPIVRPICTRSLTVSCKDFLTAGGVRCESESRTER